MQQGCPQPHEEVPSALETLLLESASYKSGHCVISLHRKHSLLMFCFLSIKESSFSKFILQIMDCLCPGNSFITNLALIFSPPLSSSSVFHTGVIQKYALLYNIPNHLVPHCWLTVNWERMAHGFDKYSLLLENINKQMNSTARRVT
jgi:hypothetical protein